jgi:flagellar hook-length control protein FliK
LKIIADRLTCYFKNKFKFTEAEIGKGGESMSNLSFIPPATAKSVQDLQHTSSFEKKTESGPSIFEQFLQKADKKQFKTNFFMEKQDQSRPVEKKSKLELKKDEFKTADQSYGDKLESRSKPETAVDGRANNASQPQSEKEKVTAETEDNQDQEVETSVDGNQDQLAELLAHLAQAEAAIRGETQPETVQMAELAEAMADPELVEAIQGTAASSGEANGASIVNVAGINQIASKTGANDENIKLNLEGLTEVKTGGMEQLSQIIHQASENSPQSEGDFLANQGNSDGKDEIPESGKVSVNANLQVEDQTFSKATLTEKSLSQKEEGNPQFDGNQILAQHDQSSAKSGKVNLAVIQTRLAVNDTPEAKTDTPLLNAVATQPSFGTVSQTQVSGSETVNATNREELFSQIVEHAKVVVNNGDSEMEINLKPEHLGKLQLKVTIENDVVTAKFFAESQQVKEIIESNLNQLKQNLQENGMQVDTIMVSVGNHQGNEGFDQAAYNQEQFNNSGGRVAGINDDAVLETQESTPPAQSDTLIDLIA